MKSLYLLAICCLVLTASTACSNGRAENSNIERDTHKPTMDVKLDVSGNQATVTVTTTDMRIAPEHYGMKREEGEGHIHMYLDNGEKIGIKEEQTVFKDLAAGKHSLKISLHNNDHTPYDVTKTIDFEIK